LVPKLGKEATESLIIFNETTIKSELEKNSNHLATKEDLAKVEAKLRAQILESKAETIKWMFIFWVGQVIATTASLLLFFKK
jgi:hypothetical protein